VLSDSGFSILPSGRFVLPAGEKIRVSRAPYGLAVSPNGKQALIVHSNAVSLVQLDKDSLSVERFPKIDGTGLDLIKGASFIGIQCSPDNKTAYISGGDKGVIWIFDFVQKAIIDSIDAGAFHPQAPHEAFVTDILLDMQNNCLWVLDRAWQQVYQVDIRNKKLINSFPTGRIPIGLALSDNNKFLLIANVGVYDYPLLPGVTKDNGDSLYLNFPPYAAYTAESDTGIWINNRKIPGLGSPLSDKAMSVWILDITKSRITSKIKTGLQIGQLIEDCEIVGGSHPSAIVCHGGYAYVSQTQNDNIAVLDLKRAKVKRYIKIETGTRLDSVRGYFPFGIDIDPVSRRLYVALMGMNAVAIIDLKKNKTVGLIPAGWGTTRVKYSRQRDELLVTSARGLGAGPNGGAYFTAPPQGTYVGDIQLGLFQRIKNITDYDYVKGREIVLKNTYKQNTDKTDIRLQDLPIKHIVYITKENRTFDEVFGQLKGVNGDSSLARFGVNCEDILKNQLKKFGLIISQTDSPSQSISQATWNKLGLDSAYMDSLLRAKHLSVTPNHHKIAKTFTLSDNFYCDSDASIHGHHWMMGTIPNEYVETNSANAGDYRLFSPAVGRRFPRTTGAQDPEDYNEIGGLWEALKRNNISVYNFGEANEYTSVQEEWDDTANGTALAVPFPMPEAIFPKTSRKYAGYNMNIPDQFRVEQFEEEFREKWLSDKGDSMPQIITIQLPNDHTTSPRPEDGYPLVHSYVADNDLALGRIVHFLSHTKYWENMLIIITEDDPQGGVDHIDAHRSLLFMAGPYVKRGHVSHTHANFGSIIKTIYQLLNINPVNHYDLTAANLKDFFTTRPNFSRYVFDKSDTNIFNPETALKKYNRSIPWTEIKMSEKMDSEMHIKKINDEK
jgi:DNA-binding beta-propeller fold protein YncE